MNREELIGLRKQILKVLNEGRGLPLDVLAAQIVLVFEQAHTLEVQALAEAVARAWDDGFDTALDDIGASVLMSEHGEDLNPYRKKD